MGWRGGISPPPLRRTGIISDSILFLFFALFPANWFPPFRPGGGNLGGFFDPPCCNTGVNVHYPSGNLPFSPLKSYIYLMATLTIHNNNKTYTYDKIQVQLDSETLDILNRFCRVVKQSRSKYVAGIVRATAVGMRAHLEALEELQRISDPKELHRRMTEATGILNAALEASKYEV